MRSYLSKYVNRETEQHLIDLICSFCDTEWDSCVMKVKVFIRKSREIGTVYAEKYSKTNNKHFQVRRYLTQTLWIGQVNVFADKALDLLLAARFYSRLAGLGLPITDLIEKITYNNFLLSSF